ncbi:MAG: hypothetical protein ACK5MZ_03785 [Aestuariibaculum sp.]
MNKIKQAKNLDFGDIINESIELFKQVWLNGFLVILLIAIFSFVIALIFGFFGLAVDPYNYMGDLDFDGFVFYFYKNLLFGFPQAILIGTLTIALLAGFYRICKNVATGSNKQEDYFYFFNKAHFSKVFMLGIIYATIASVAQAFLIIPYLYFYVPLSYFAVILAFNPNLTETEIVKASFALGNKKWLISFGTMFVVGLLSLLGVIACVVGLLFTVSIVYLPNFLIYKKAIGFEEGYGEIDQIGTLED